MRIPGPHTKLKITGVDSWLRKSNDKKDSLEMFVPQAVFVSPGEGWRPCETTEVGAAFCNNGTSQINGNNLMIGNGLLKTNF